MSTRRRNRMRRLITWLRREWDAMLSVLAVSVFWMVTATSSRALEPVQSLFAAAVALGATVGFSAFVTGRWVSDRLAKDEYGTVIVAFDPDESETQRPYFIMSLTGLVTAAFGIFMAIVAGELSRPLAVTLYGVMLGLASYCVLGSISLVTISRRHQKRASILRAMKEDAAREERKRRGDGAKPT
jgi:hypothetical protein